MDTGSTPTPAQQFLGPSTTVRIYTSLALFLAKTNLRFSVRRYQRAADCRASGRKRCETVAGCCPSGYDCFKDGGSCVSVVIADSITVTECSSGQPIATSTMHLLTILTTSKSKSPTVQPTLAEPPASIPSTQVKSGLSIKAKLIISAVIPVVVLVVVALFVSLLVSWRKRRVTGMRHSTGYTKPELDAPNTVQKMDKVLVEMPALDSPREVGLGLSHELAAPEAVHELESSDISCASVRTR
ncbi:hypothetical protein EV356DRAFT_519582 [Viridothelium virens]|uniref:Uncharacterized protein n=1 Tax=Viridothelium virens TaxID=1048519 RepID=A0A6A6HJ95_VIRVR|nr:hypothetical protein EV356DRAFT_519582 [Viridothelium virens]